MKRETWGMVALIGVGYFLHDAIWHALLATAGMNGWVAMEFSLPDLGPMGVHPDRAIQGMAFAIAVLFAVLLALTARRLRRN